ncbi:hypothetical protein VTL71DRAFT_10308 [Oculimacula yallundae]|uniref:2EXR domain-containing protein n=1 Tax=Oculimacula yallundae TaxID=86028 RepID=A0ABR4CSM1_9HELO
MSDSSSNQSSNTGAEEKAIDFAVSTENFTVFLNLPLELQIEIWKFALPGPRELLIEDFEDGSHLVRNGRATAIPTPLLHTNYESRRIALRRYSRYNGPWEGNPFYFCLKLDTLHFRGAKSIDLLKDYRKFTETEVDSLEMYQHLQHIRVTVPRSIRMRTLIRNGMRSLKTFQVDASYGILALSEHLGIPLTTSEVGREIVQLHKRLCDRGLSHCFRHQKKPPVVTIDAGDLGMF